MDLAVAEFEEAGYRIVLDGKLLPATDPLLPLQALPERLKAKVYVALADVLGQDPTLLLDRRVGDVILHLQGVMGS